MGSAHEDEGVTGWSAGGNALDQEDLRCGYRTYALGTQPGMTQR